MQRMEQYHFIGLKNKKSRKRERHFRAPDMAVAFKWVWHFWKSNIKAASLCNADVPAVAHSCKTLLWYAELAICYRKAQDTADLLKKLWRMKLCTYITEEFSACCKWLTLHFSIRSSKSKLHSGYFSVKDEEKEIYIAVCSLLVKKQNVSLRVTSSEYESDHSTPGPGPPAWEHFAHGETSERWTHFNYFPLLKWSKSVSKRFCARRLQTDLIPENPEDPSVRMQIKPKFNPDWLPVFLPAGLSFDDLLWINLSVDCKLMFILSPTSWPISRCTQREQKKCRFWSGVNPTCLHSFM